jgi:hypothetical protein
MTFDELLNFVFSEPPALFSGIIVNLKQVVLQKIEYKVQLIIYPEDLVQTYQIGVLQLPERLDLSELDALIPVMIFLLHFFDGDDLVLLYVDGFEHGPERAVADRLSDLVLLHILLIIIYRNLSQFGMGFWGTGDELEQDWAGGKTELSWGRGTC